MSDTPEEDAHVVDHGLRVGRVVGGLLGLAATLEGATAVQLVAWTPQRPWVVAAELAFVALAASSGLAASGLARASVRGAAGGVVLGGLGAAVSAAWFLAMLASGALTLIPLLAAPAACFSALGALAMVPIARRVEAARARLG